MLCTQTEVAKAKDIYINSWKEFFCELQICLNLLERKTQIIYWTKRKINFAKRFENSGSLILKGINLVQVDAWTCFWEYIESLNAWEITKRVLKHFLKIDLNIFRESKVSLSNDFFKLQEQKVSAKNLSSFNSVLNKINILL